jgi:hypothetical protein
VATESILILDVEGVDSGERARIGDINFEKQTSLFSLALCSVLMINVKADDIGRSQAANLDLFKIIFELNLQLFVREENNRAKTLILFVLRDHAPNRDLNQITLRMMDDLKSVWTKIAKPKSFEDSRIEDFFDFMFFPMPHKIYFPDEFDRKANEFKDMFVNKNNKQFLLKSSYKKRIPADGFCAFAQQIWSQIVANKDLDLPDQFRLLAQYRCNEIAEIVLSEFKTSLDSQRDSIFSDSTKPLKSFEFASNAAKQAGENYHNRTQFYNRDESEKKWNELNEKLEHVLIGLFNRNLEKLRNVQTTEFLTELKTKISQSGESPILDFAEFARSIVGQFVSKFVRIVESTVVPEYKWDVSNEIQEFEASLQFHIQTERSNQIRKIVESQGKQVLPRLYSKTLSDAGESMWTTIRRIFEENRERVYAGTESERGINDVLTRGFEAAQSEIEETVRSIDRSLRSALFKLIKDFTNGLPNVMARHFERRFKFDENGFARRWKAEDDVENLCFVARTETEPIINRFAVFRLNPDMDNVVFFSTEKEFVPPLVNELDLLLSFNECEQFSIQFQREVNRDLEAALLAKKNASPPGIPKWAVLVFLFFSANEIFYVLTNPFMVMLMILFGGGGYVLYVTGLWQPLRPLVMSRIQGVIEQVEALDLPFLNHDQQQQPPRQPQQVQ